MLAISRQAALCGQDHIANMVECSRLAGEDLPIYIFKLLWSVELDSFD